ncbi:MAG: hypothetical protein BroJett018_16370 [Chloroflexota bacterium]|nr:hypothetical protein [Chloroflexota bacterium]NOG65678.1 hypothetical protein [Chloroflexota bacterium]GIK63843.1 MAG: hypothetical protein BroJett018_16370 [Chloroflexota bacterium]
MNTQVSKPLPVHDFAPAIEAKEDGLILVKNETARGAQLLIQYDEPIGYRRPITIQRSITRHVKRTGVNTYEYRWLEPYRDVKGHLYLAEYVAAYIQDGLTAELTGVFEARKGISPKERAA